jgi:hypothetical protein
MADKKIELLLEEYFNRRKELCQVYEKDKNTSNFNRLHSFSNLVSNILNKINMEIQTKCNDGIFNNYFWNNFIMEQNNLELTDNMKRNISLLKNISKEAELIIFKYLDALDNIDLEKVDEDNKILVGFYFRKKFIDVFFKWRELNGKEIMDIDKMLNDLEIKTNMNNDYIVVENIIVNAKADILIKFVKMFLEYIDNSKKSIKKEIKKDVKKVEIKQIFDSKDIIKVKPKRTVTVAQKKIIAGKQFNKCANKPDSKLKGLEGYMCPLWLRNDEHKGCFDQSGYDIDHIVEFSSTNDDSDENLQALCKNCHTVKTKKFGMKKKSK